MTAAPYFNRLKPADPRSHLTRCEWPGCRWTYVGEEAKAAEPERMHVMRMHARRRP